MRRQVHSWGVGALIVGALALVLWALPAPVGAPAELGLGFSLAGPVLSPKAKEGPGGLSGLGVLRRPLVLQRFARSPSLRTRPQPGVRPGRRSYLLFRRLVLEGG